MTATEIRQQIQTLISSGKRGARVRDQIADLQWELDHMTAADAINARRADMGLPPWPSA